MERHHRALCAVDVAVRQLQQFGHNRRRVWCDDVLALQADDLILFELPVLHQLHWGQLHQDDVVDPLRQCQIVRCAHAHTDVADPALDLFLGSSDRDPLVNHIAAAGSCFEALLAICAQCLAQALTSVQEVHLSP